MKDRIETYSISQVSQMAGVSKNRIREWHSKGFLPDVQTISVGTRLHRRFSGKDAALIQSIGEYQKQGYLLRTAAEKAREQGCGGAL